MMYLRMLLLVWWTSSILWNFHLGRRSDDIRGNCSILAGLTGLFFCHQLLTVTWLICHNCLVDCVSLSVLHPSSSRLDRSEFSHGLPVFLCLCLNCNIVDSEDFSRNPLVWIRSEGLEVSSRLYVAEVISEKQRKTPGLIK